MVENCTLPVASSGHITGFLKALVMKAGKSSITVAILPE